MFGLIKNILSIFSRKPGGLDPITKSYISGMTTKPSVEFTKVIDTYFVRNSKTVNGTKYTMKQLIAKADVIYLGNINDSNDSFRNLVKNAHHGTKQGSGLVWDAYWGYSNPDGTGYVDTNYIPKTQAVKLELNNTGLGIYLTKKSADTGVFILGCQDAGNTNRLAILHNNSSGDLLCYTNVADAQKFSSTNNPFLKGLQFVERNAANSSSHKNQNKTNTTSTGVSNDLASSSIKLFNVNSYHWKGGLNFTYIGASLTDDEFTALNLIVNEYLIQCLYLKYGASNWGVQMAKSYFDTLHNFEPYEAWEVYEFIKRHQSDYLTSNDTYPVINAGGTGQSDWVDSNLDGIADNWEDRLGTAINGSIVTGNGFTNNAQRCEAKINATYMALQNTPNALTIGRKYLISVKYRSNKNIAFANGSSTISPVLIANTGSAIEASVIGQATQANYLSIIMQSPVIGDWFEVDELNVSLYQEQGYYYNTFGPSGQNKTVADYIMLFKAGGNLLANVWTKTGNTLRWNQDGAITSSNTMPAYTRGTNLGIVTVTSTDGWNGVTAMTLNQTGSSVNSFYGNFPNFHRLKTSGTKIAFTGHSNRYKYQTESGFINTYRGFLAYNTYPGYGKFDVSHLVGGTFNGDVYFTSVSNPTAYIGDVTTITNEFSGTNWYFSVSATTRQENLIGSLANVILSDTLLVMIIIYNGITAGTTTWNKYLGTFQLTGCRLNTAAVDNQLSVINTYFATNTPIKNVTINLSGSTMGIPTGGASNTDLLGIVAKHVAAGFTATITVRES